MVDICCIGHITLDEIITSHSITHLPGGTSWYFSNAISKLPVKYQLITGVADSERYFVNTLQDKGIDVQCFRSTHTIKFINSYAEDQNNRTQKVTQEADAFTPHQLDQANAGIVHLGPLTASDIPAHYIPSLSSHTKVSLDVQGYLRNIIQQQVIPVEWESAKSILPFITYLKTNEHELEVLTGSRNIYDGAKMLAALGVSEVIVTRGSFGSVILYNSEFYKLPAYPPNTVVDATGCGDTYMAGYLYKRSRGTGVDEAGRFAAAMATLKINCSGAFDGSEEEVLAVINVG